MKYLLHIDTSGDIGIVALSCDGELISSSKNTETRNHAGSINIMIEELLASAKITFKELAAVVVCAGPGSYTGLRIGLSTAKGFCYALNIPLLLDNKLTLLAYQAWKKYNNTYMHYIAVLLAREKEFFVSEFNNHFENTTAAAHIIDQQLDNLLNEKSNICIISSHFPEIIQQKHTENIYVTSETEIDLKTWAFYAFEQYTCNKTVNLSTAEPFYLKQVYTHK